MITTRFIQRELAEFRRMIQQDMREELRAVFESRGLCTNCVRDVASLRGLAMGSSSFGDFCSLRGSSSRTPPLISSDANRGPSKDTVRHRQDESGNCMVRSVRFDDTPSKDGHHTFRSVSELSSERAPEQIESNQLPRKDESNGPLPPETPPIPLPAAPEDALHDLEATSNNSTTITDQSNPGRTLESCDCDINVIMERWTMLCAGILERTSVVHEHWLPKKTSIRPSGFSLLSTAMFPTITQLTRTSHVPVILEAPAAWWILDPFSTRRFSWDIIGISLCFYDLFMVPIQSAFTLPPSYETFRNTRDFFSTCFWTLDIFISFVTGSPDKDGLVEVRPEKIARKYMTTWFLLDLIIVTIDWVLFFMSAFGVSGSMRIGKAFTRVLRASRLLRILKMTEKVREVMGTVETEFLFTIGTVMKQIGFLLVVCHYFACAWYSIGMMQDDSRSWQSVYLNGSDTVLYAYAASLHYSLTQFSFGYADITPQTVPELFFVNTLLVLALLVFSMFTSSVSRAIRHLEEVNSVQLAEDVLVRQFCAENHVPRQLMARIRNFMRQRSRSYNRRMISENDVEVFHALPIRILQQLREHRFMRHLVAHPLFKQCSTMHPKSLRELCWTGIEEAFLLPGQEMFSNFVDINRMLFLLTGRLRYRLDEDISEAEDVTVLPGEWACEETLWSRKAVLAAPFLACDGSQLLLVVPNSLREIITQELFIYDFLRVYAKLFIERFNHASWNDMDDCVLFNDPSTVQPMVREAWTIYARSTESRKTISFED